MFNPYAVRPIGSQQFEKHLKDIQTTRWYELGFSESDDVQDCIFVHGYLPWDTGGDDPFEAPWRKLWTAIASFTIMDYLDCYLKRNYCLFHDDEPGYHVWESRCLDLENNYFRRYEYTDLLFDKLLVNVCWMGESEIRKCRSRINKVLNWTLYGTDSHQKHRRQWEA